jgi:MFS superfamily sulfate permease-like transporter
MLGLVVIVAGLVQIIAGAMRLGPWFRAVSPAVIHGMLAGIGVLIFASQFHVMVDDKPRGSGLENLATIPQAIYKAVGIPRIPGEQEREFRTHALQATGDLHDEQINLLASIAGLIPYHNIDHDSLDRIVEPRLRDSVETQQFITAGLKDLAQQLETVEQESAGAIHLNRAKAAFAEAIARSQEAEAALESGKGVDAVRTQEAAAAALDVATSRLKSHHLAASLGLLTIAVIILWQKFAPQRLRLVPAPLLAIVAATVLAAIFLLPVLYVEIPANLAHDIHFPTWSLVQSAPWGEVLKTALLVAVVASAETLLCATAVDKIASGSRTNYDRELAGQGVGNMICGALGALPMTGVIVRSSANVQAGAQTRLSAILHGAWLLLFVVFLSGMLQMIPTASLAAVLVFTGYKLVNFKEIKKLREAGWGEVAIYLTTLTTIVVEDLLTGVLVGLALAAAKLLYTFSRLKVKVERDDLDGRFRMDLAGAATFVRLPKLAAALEKVPENAQLHVDLSGLTYIDHACLELLTSWAQQHEQTGGRLTIDWDTLHAAFREGPQNGATKVAEDTWVDRPEPALSR